MKSLVNGCFGLLFCLMITGCGGDQVWTKVVPCDQEKVDEALNHSRENGMMVSFETLAQSGLMEAQTREAFSEAIKTLPAGAESRVGPSLNFTLLHYFVSGDKSDEWIEFLIDAGASLESLDSAGEKPLHPAVMRGDIATARLLLEKGADPNSADIYGYTPLFKWAIYTRGEKLKEMYSLLIEYGADPHVYRVSTTGSDEYPTPYDCIRYRAEKRDDVEAELMLQEMTEPPNQF